MPMKWVEPDTFLTAPNPDGDPVTVYRAYKDGNYNRPLRMHFSMNDLDDDDTFDVRDLELVRADWEGLRESVLGGDQVAMSRVVAEAVRLGQLLPPAPNE